MCVPTRAAWACRNFPNISPGPTGSNGSRSANGSTASAANRRPDAAGLTAAAACYGVLRNTLAYQLIQVRFELQCGTGSIAARRGARRILKFAAQLQGRELRLVPRP